MFKEESLDDRRLRLEREVREQLNPMLTLHEDAKNEFDNIKDDHFKNTNAFDDEVRGLSCEMFSKRLVECQYRSITHPTYGRQCAVLSLMMEMCHRSRDLLLNYQSGVIFYLFLIYLKELWKKETVVSKSSKVNLVKM